MLRKFIFTFQCITIFITWHPYQQSMAQNCPNPKVTIRGIQLFLYFIAPIMIYIKFNKIHLIYNRILMNDSMWLVTKHPVLR